MVAASIYVIQKEVSVVKTILDTNENLLVLYPTKECIIAKFLHYQDEIQELPKSYFKIEVSKLDLDMVNALIESMTKKLDISAYQDDYQRRLQNTNTTKINGNKIVSADMGNVPNNVINLKEALQRSVDLAKNSRASTA